MDKGICTKCGTKMLCGGRRTGNQPVVNSHEIIKLTSGTKVRRSQRLRGHPIEFLEIAISGFYKDICTTFGGKMHHRHIEMMTVSPKIGTDILKLKLLDIISRTLKTKVDQFQGL